MVAVQKKKSMVDGISIEVDGDIIFTTVAKYKLFLSYGRIGMDAYLMYSHYQFTARIQQTNIVKATEWYVRQGLEIGEDRFRKAKNLLLELGLIEQIVRKDEKGRVTGYYVLIKTKTTPFEVNESPVPSFPGTGENQPLGKPTTKCLNEQDKCLNEQLKALALIVDRWNTSGCLTIHAIATANRKFHKKHYDEISDYGIPATLAAIDNYAEVLSSDKYYWSHRYSLWDFIARALDKFVPDAKPRENFLKKNNTSSDGIPTTNDAIRKAYA